MTPTPARRRRPGWLLDEVASAGRENLDAGHVARYDSKEDTGATDEVALLCRLGLTDGSIVIDLGAGTGQFTLAVAASCARVVAVDVSPVMLDLLRAKLAGTGMTNVDLVQADSSPTSTWASRPTSSTPATPCTTSLMHGRRSP